MARPVAFVTGASYGVGAATALALARDGFDVAVSATQPGNVADTVAKLHDLGARAVPVALDLRQPASIDRAFAEVSAALGHLDVLVNNAGANLRKAALDVTAAEWHDV